LQQLPVLQAILLRAEQRFGRLAFAIEMLGKPAFAAGEIDEVDRLARLGVLSRFCEFLGIQLRFCDLSNQLWLKRAQISAVLNWRPSVDWFVGLEQVHVPRRNFSENTFSFFHS
jgi:hypothetical protein